MPKVLEGTARELILNIKKFCEAEKESKALLVPLSNVRGRVAALAGVSVKTVSRIIKEGKAAAATSSRLVTPGKKRPHPKKIVLDNVVLGFIRQKIHNYYVSNKELPSVNKLRLELVQEIDFPGSNSTLRRILKNIGLRFKTPPAGSLTDKTARKKKIPKPKEAIIPSKFVEAVVAPQEQDPARSVMYIQRPYPPPQMPSNMQIHQEMHHSQMVPGPDMSIQML